MKAFDRFPHEGVKADLISLMNSIKQRHSEVQFGSSGDGELTIRGKHITAYVRKYRSKKGWKLVICRRTEPVFSQDFESSSEVEVRIAAFDK